jgi:uncharacterized protein (TIGR02145 family)
MNWLISLLVIIALCAAFSPIEGLIYIVLTRVTKRPAKLFITIPAAGVVAVLVLLALVMWVEDSDEQTEGERPYATFEEGAIILDSISGAKMLYCGPENAPYAITATLTSNDRPATTIRQEDYSVPLYTLIAQLINNNHLTISGKGAMMDYDNLIIPWNIVYDEFGRELGYKARNSIAEVVIEDGVTHIGNKAFSGLTGLRSVTISNSVKSIGSEAFYLCGSLTSITIPSSVDTIGTVAFGKCNNLSSVTISNGVTAIGRAAFAGCGNLSSITIPSSVRSIGERAFFGCTGLTSVTIPSGVTTIGLHAFTTRTDEDKNCSDPVITVAEDNAYYSSEDGILFNKNKTLLIQYPRHRQNREYTIPSGVVAIGEEAFANCDILTSITIPGHVKSIGKQAFLNCGGLTSVTIENGVQSIKDGAFSGCGRLTSIAIPGSVKIIEDGTFDKCKRLTSVTIEDGVTAIGYAAFSGCSNLRSVIIPNSVTIIKEEAFNNCENLTSVTMLNGVPPSILYETFYGLPAKACLYVPKCAVNAYRAADVWDEFKCVKPIAAGIAADCVSDSAESVGIFTDTRDGKRYKSVVIGGKRWMAKNLNYETDSSWCYINDDVLCKTYGRLYAWNAARSACPLGWHLPSRMEWNDLMQAVGGEKRVDKDGDIYWDGAGKKLKARIGWKDLWRKSGNGTDDYGFFALPGGDYEGNGTFYGWITFGAWWTATEYDSARAYQWSMGGGSDNVSEYNHKKRRAFSVRCVADSP